MRIQRKDQRVPPSHNTVGLASIVSRFSSVIIRGGGQVDQKLIDRTGARADIKQRRAVARIQRHSILGVVDRRIERITTQQALGNAGVS